MNDARTTPRWTAAIALLAAVLWVAQLAGGWAPPYRAGEIVQQSEAGLTQVIESEWGAKPRAQAPEREADPSVLPGAEALFTASRARQILTLTAHTPAPQDRTHTRPGIRAPPHTLFSV